MHVGSQGRFSTDLDFTATEDHDHEAIILDMMEAFEAPFHGLGFSIPGENYYEVDDGMSWGVSPTYVHDWNQAGSEIKMQISRRETPTLVIERRAQCDQSYFRFLPFEPAEIDCIALPEIIAEKIRACYQRNKARDMYDLGMFARRPMNQPVVRRLVVLKLWQAGDSFDPQRLMQKFADRTAFDWDDLGQLLRGGQAPDPEAIIADCQRGYAFLGDLSAEEGELAQDAYRRKRALHEALTDSCGALA